jgi:hypothetical protein
MFAIRLLVRPVKPMALAGMRLNFKYASGQATTAAAIEQSKRSVWKKKGLKSRKQVENTLQVVAYSTADYYDLDLLKKAFFDEGRCL